MTPLDVVVSVGAAAWVGATVLRHLPSRWLPAGVDANLNGGSLAWLVPSWNFFAPVPGTHTYCLLYRDEHVDGSLGLWREVHTPSRQSWTRCLWNPEKTGSKAVLDLAMELARTVQAAGDRPQLVRLAVPYLTALAHVTSRPHSLGATGTQFILLQRSASASHVLFLSEVHPLAHSDDVAAVP